MPDIFINGINICAPLPKDNCVIDDPTSGDLADSNAFQSEGVVAPDDTGPDIPNDNGDSDPTSMIVADTTTTSKIPPLDTHPNTITQPPDPV